MFSFKTIFFLVLAVNLCKIDAIISDKRLCVDEQCLVQVAEGKTLIRYSSPDRRILSFAPNTPVKIYSHAAGSKPMYIGVEINGKRGYVNKEHIRETRILKKPTLTVPTEDVLSNPKDDVLEIQPEGVKQEYEIIDGTKIFIDTGLGSSTPFSEPIKSSTVGVPDQLSNEKTKDLVLDLNKNENVIKSSQIKLPKVEDIVKQPDIEPKTLEEPKNIVEELASNVGNKIYQKNKEQNPDGETGKPVENFVQEFADRVDNSRIVKNSASEDKEDSDEVSENLDNAISVDEVDNTKVLEKSASEDKADSSKVLENADNVEDQENDEDDEEFDDHDDDNDDEGDEQEEKGFFGKIVDTLERFGSTVDKIDQKEAIINEKISQDSKISEPLNENNVIPTYSKFTKGDVNVNVNEKPSQDANILNSYDVTDILKKHERKENFNEIISSSKEHDAYSNKNNEVKDGGTIKLTGNILNKQVISTLEENKGQTDANNLNEKQANIVNTEDPKKLEKLPEKSVSLIDQMDIPTTTSSLYDNAALPVNYVVTPDPVLNNDIAQERKYQKVLLDTKNEKSEDAQNILEKPVEYIGLFNEPKIVVKEILQETNEPKNPDLGPNKTTFINVTLAQEEPKNVLIKEDLADNNGPMPIAPEENSPSRPDLGPNEPTFIDVTPQQEESKKVLIEEDLDDNNVTEEFKISAQDLKISDGEVKLAEENSNGILSSISSFFGGAGGSGSKEVKQRIETASPSYEDTVGNSDIAKEIVEEPFIKTNAYVTGNTDPILNNADKVKEETLIETEFFAQGDKNPILTNELLNLDSLSKTEDNIVKTLDTENLAADRSSEFSHFSRYSKDKVENVWSSNHDRCDNEQCFNNVKESMSTVTPSLSIELILQSFSSDLFLYLSTTAISMVIFLFLHMILNKCKREAPLISRINKLEQELLATRKENQLLQEQDSTLVVQPPETVIQGVPNEIVEELTEQLKEIQAAKVGLEEQVAALEKELDNSTEVGIELNRIISDMLSSSDGSEILRGNVEQMQKRLLDQQDTINSINENLNLRDTENHELRLELEISNKKVLDLQGELDKMVERILKIEEERDAQYSALENEIEVYQVKVKEAAGKENGLRSEVQVLKTQLAEFQRTAELKIKEFNILKESIDEIKAIKNNKDTIKSLLEVTAIKAQLEQFKSENSRYSEQLRLENESNVAYAKKIQTLSQEVGELRASYEKADKEKVESRTKLEVLNNYFKEKEEQMQKEISKYESLWAVKEGQATSTTERIRLLQEELQNYKAQNESLKQEIMSQEVELKSQISVLEKKAHESWMTSRQTERKLEEAKQEAAQLRNRLTMKERAALEGSSKMRIQSPLHQNGDMPLSPPPLDSALSPPPPLRDLAMSPPLPGLPPLAFLPPPPGGLPPFIPPPPGGLLPHGMPPFMPPPIFPGDHRPPPLGRMSSPPPHNSRSYSPQSTIFSEYDRYDRNTPSPIYDSEYGVSPPARAYSPYEERLRDERLWEDRRDFRRDEDRREYDRPHGRSNGRTSKGLSSGSETELGKMNRKPNKKV